MLCTPCGVNTWCVKSQDSVSQPASKRTTERPEVMRKTKRSLCVSVMHCLWMMLVCFQDIDLHLYMA